MHRVSGGSCARARVDGNDGTLGGAQQEVFRRAQARSAVGQARTCGDGRLQPSGGAKLRSPAGELVLALTAEGGCPPPPGGRNPRPPGGGFVPPLKAGGGPPPKNFPPPPPFRY